MAKILDVTWTIDQVDIPVHLHEERRSNRRVSITKTGIHIRLPKTRWRKASAVDLSWAQEWVEEQVRIRPSLIEPFRLREYHNGQQIITPAHTYQLRINSESRANGSGKVIGDTLQFRLPKDSRPKERSLTIQKLLPKVIGKHQLPRIRDRLHQINDRYIRREIKAVRIKDNSSNWGSCSSTGNINIAARTLLTPLWVQDYICVHELAHLIELNHSAQYWSIVAGILPNYDEAERWLKTDGPSCQF